MAKAGAVRVEGARQLRASFRELGLDLQDFKEVNGKVASFVGVKAAAAAPRRSGALAVSWRPGAAKTNATVRFGGVAVPYGNAVHWGTGARVGMRGPHNIARNPFAWRAAGETQSTWLPWYVEQMQRLVNKVRGA